MRTWWLVSLFGALTISTPCFAATQVEVLSTKSWQSTGVTVNQGNTYGVWETGGKWTVDQRNFPYVVGAGYPPQIDAKIFQGCKYNSSWPYGLLLGKVGTSIFPIGRGRSFTAPLTGALELSINDQASCLADNAGSLYVKVHMGLNSQGLLNQLLLNQLLKLSPAEAAVLGLLATNIATCKVQLESLTNGPWSTACQGVAQGLLSLILFPREVQ